MSEHTPAFIPTGEVRPEYPTEPGEFLVLYGYTKSLCADLWILGAQGWIRSEDGELCDPQSVNAVAFKRVPDTVEQLLDNACKVAFAEMWQYFDAPGADDLRARYSSGERTPELLASMQALTKEMEGATER